MMSAPVTFVVPVFNGAAFLSTALDSVLVQTRVDWRAILIDDASSDGSSQIIDACTDPRVRKLHNEHNRGLYASLRRAIRHADSEWVSILMQDDRLHPDYLDRMSGMSLTYPDAGAIWPAHYLVDDRGRIFKKGASGGRIELIHPGVEPWLSALQRGCFWIISGSYTRRALFEALPFRTDLPHCGDYEWLLRSLRRAVFLYYEMPLVDIREHPAQASARNLHSALDIVESYRVIEDALACHPGDVPFAASLQLAWRRFRLVSRRGLAASARGRWMHAAWLGAWASRFLLLPLRMRLAGQPDRGNRRSATVDE
jgi:glycosyltransferase involved in cell wall biosynthesis